LWIFSRHSVAYQMCTARYHHPAIFQLTNLKSVISAENILSFLLSFWSSKRSFLGVFTLMIRRALCSASNCLKRDNRLRRYSLSRIDFCWRDDQSLLNHTYKLIIFLFVEWQYFFVVIRFRPRAPVSLWTKDSGVHLRCFSFLA